MKEPALLFRTTPPRTPRTIRERFEVQRSDLILDAEERIRESILTGNKHHLLFVGGAGLGKSHLLRSIVDRIEAAAPLREKLPIAWIPEHQTIPSYLDLLHRIYLSAGLRSPDRFPISDLTPAYEAPGDSATARIEATLLERLDGETMLLVLENLDRTFAGLQDDGQKRLRALLQESARFSILASSRTLFEGISDRTAPFFGFFQIEHLSPLTEEETRTLLKRIANLKGDRDLSDTLTTPRGISRVKAIHPLLRGNHRLVVTLSNHLDSNRLDELATAIEGTLDDSTPEYLALLARFSPQQRRIMDELSRCGHPTSVKEIAQKLFITNQTASGQLKDLRDRGIVTSTSRGRESLYEPTDSLLRLCPAFLDLGTSGVRPLVRFLRSWYEEVENGELCEDYVAACLVLAPETADRDSLDERISKLTRKASRTKTLESLGKGLVLSLRSHTQMPPTRESADAWIATWKRQAHSFAELKIPLRLFATGLQSLAEQDFRILYDLASEERAVLRELLEGQGLTPDQPRPRRP